MTVHTANSLHSVSMVVAGGTAVFAGVLAFRAYWRQKPVRPVLFSIFLRLAGVIAVGGHLAMETFHRHRFFQLVDSHRADKPWVFVDPARVVEDRNWIRKWKEALLTTEKLPTPYGSYQAVFVFALGAEPEGYYLLKRDHANRDEWYVSHIGDYEEVRFLHFRSAEVGELLRQITAERGL